MTVPSQFRSSHELHLPGDPTSCAGESDSGLKTRTSARPVGQLCYQFTFAEHGCGRAAMTVPTLLRQSAALNDRRPKPVCSPTVAPESPAFYYPPALREFTGL